MQIYKCTYIPSSFLDLELIGGLIIELLMISDSADGKPIDCSFVIELLIVSDSADGKPIDCSFVIELLIVLDSADGKPIN